MYLSDVEVVYLSDVDAVYLSGVGYQPAVETMYLDSYLSCYLDAVQRDYQYTIYVPSHIYTLYNAEIDRYARLYTLPGVNYLIQSYNI